MASMDEVCARKNLDLESLKRIAKGDKPEYGKGKPADWQPDLVNAELQKMMKGDQDSLYYLARQPIFRHKGEGKFVVNRWEILLRSFNGTQAFPTAVAYSHPLGLRLEFTEHQLRLAMKLTESPDAKPMSVNVYAKDLIRLKGWMKSNIANSKVIVELVEFEKEVDGPGFPSMAATFDDELKSTIKELGVAGVKISLDDVSHILGEKHPLSFAFALDVLDHIHEIKFDIKTMVQIFDQFPNIPNAERFMKKAASPEDLETTRAELKEFVEEVWRRKPGLQMVLELSVITEEVASRFPALSPFDSTVMDRILVQGGATDDWAERIPL
eukprot:gb/GFBE01026980.1/.p1 GENE.gb/GFBE01026980.1/~~gb/GFBE01026980.1/.p1  ORF type:complete len:326 (+),score=97.88 gb/GFBE01026980.1/:1-978(+)